MLATKDNNWYGPLLPKARKLDTVHESDFRENVAVGGRPYVVESCVVEC